MKENTQLEDVRKKKTALALLLGFLIGVECGFLGSGGGVLMLSVFMLVLGLDLKTAVGTSTLVMSLVALTGAVSHLALGAVLEPIAAGIIILTCLVAAVVSAKYANQCHIIKLNRIVGTVLIILSVVSLAV